MIHGHGDDLYRYKDMVAVNFSTNIFNHFDHSKLFGFLATRLPSITSYPEPTPVSLERAFAEHLGVGAENVMATNGATEAIYIMAQCFRNRTAYIVQPTFAEYADACHMYGCDIVNITSINGSCWGNNNMVWLCNPNNPTGSTTSHDELLNVITKYPKTVFIIDQSYSAYTTERTLSAEEACSLGNVLLLNSMTKDFAIPGIRLGYITGSEKILDEVKGYRMPWAVNCLAIEVGIYLLKHRGDYVIDTAALGCERKWVAERIGELGIKTFPSDCNMLLCELPSSDAKSLKEYLVKEHGLLIRDASNFYGLSERHFRIAVQTRDEDTKLINALREWIRL